MKTLISMPVHNNWSDQLVYNIVYGTRIKAMGVIATLLGFAVFIGLLCLAIWASGSNKKHASLAWWLFFTCGIAACCFSMNMLIADPPIVNAYKTNAFNKNLLLNDPHIAADKRLGHNYKNFNLVLSDTAKQKGQLETLYHNIATVPVDTHAPYQLARVYFTNNGRRINYKPLSRAGVYYLKTEKYLLSHKRIAVSSMHVTPYGTYVNASDSRGKVRIIAQRAKTQQRKGVKTIVIK